MEIIKLLDLSKRKSSLELSAQRINQDTNTVLGRSNDDYYAMAVNIFRNTANTESEQTVNTAIQYSKGNTQVDSFNFTVVSENIILVILKTLKYSKQSVRNLPVLILKGSAKVLAKSIYAILCNL